MVNSLPLVGETLVDMRIWERTWLVPSRLRKRPLYLKDSKLLNSRAARRNLKVQHSHRRRLDSLSKVTRLFLTTTARTKPDSSTAPPMALITNLLVVTSPISNLCSNRLRILHPPLMRRFQAFSNNLIHMHREHRGYTDSNSICRDTKITTRITTSCTVKE